MNNKHRVKEIFKSSNLFIALWVVMMMLPSGRITGGLYMLLLPICALCFISILFHYSWNSGIKVLNFWLIYLLIYGLYFFLFYTYTVNDSGLVFSKDQFIRSICGSILPIYGFYYLTLKEKLQLKDFRLWFPVFICAVVLNMIHFREEMMMLFTDAEEVVNNAGYVAVSLFALLPAFNRKPLIKYIMTLICLFIVISAMKRGPILLALVSIFIMVYFDLRKHKHNKVFLKLVIIAVVLLGGYFIWDYFMSSSDLFIARLEAVSEGNSSGRDVIWSGLLSIFANDSSLLQMLIGRGCYGTITAYGIEAHNDWLELLISNGLVGVIIYIIYWVKLFSFLKTKQKGTITYEMLVITLFILLGSTFFSMGYSNIKLFEAISLGYCLASNSDELEYCV